MRSVGSRTVFVVLLGGLFALGVGCAENGRPASDPSPQRPFNDPKPQRPNDPVANSLRPNAQVPFNDPAPQQPTFGTGGPQSSIDDPRPQKPFYGPGTSADNKVLAKTDKPLSDAEILTTLVVANDGEVQMAELAIKKATLADVKQFAGMMKSHHTNGSQKTKALQTRTKLGTAPSDLSSHLENDAVAMIKDLRDKDVASFDRAYMSSQVKAHKDVLAAIDNRLLPSATNGEVRTMLGETRRTVADHLTKAEEIQKKLDTTSSTSSSTSTGRQGSGKTGVGTPEPRDNPLPGPGPDRKGKEELPKPARPEAPPSGTR
jgi:putative membrane protein